VIRPRTIAPLDLPEGLAYFVLTTAPKREFHVARWLEEQELAFSFTPLQIRWISKVRHVRGRNKPRTRIEVPLVPRIVIAGFRGVPPWLNLDDCRHITGVLGVCGVPTAMRPGEAERLRETSAALLAPVVEKPVVVGGKAKMAAVGLFEGHVVEVTSISGKWAKVIQSWFGTKRETTVSIMDLEAA
jgi:hypothetical protein